MSDSSDNEIVPEKSRNKRRRIDESDEEYDEEESKYAKRRKDIGNYILDEAAVDDDDEEDDDYDEDNNYDDMIDHPDEVAEAQDAMQYVKYDNRARQSSLNLENEEEIEEHYRQKYEMDRDDEFGTGNAMANIITQQSCLPGVKDANLWQIKCFDGEEKNTVLKLMHKFNILRMTNRPLNVLSVFSKDSVKGYIYMEAYKETHVKTAAEDIKSISHGKSSIKMIPISEMTEIMKVLKAFKKLERGQWVRINKGLYRGDLAKVISIDEGQNSVMVQLIPRIDYKQLNKDKSKFTRQRFFVKPVAALFNRKKIAEFGLDVTKNGKYYSFRKNDFDEQGFLYKDFKMNFIDVQGVKPDMQEIENFNENINNLEVAKQVKKGLESVDQTFNIGDQVVVVAGSLKELRGKVVSIDNKNIVMYVNELNQNMSFRPDELRRYFNVGNHVRVLSGQYEGETGIVVDSDINTVVVLSDNNINQFKVKPMDLTSAASFANEAPVSNKFLIGDLIQIDPKTVGVIIQFQKSMMKVLTNMNKEIMLEISSSFSKKNNIKSVTLDGNKLEIRNKDMVDIVSGNNTGKHGEIRHVWKGFVFIYNNQFAENRGLMATRGTHVAKKGSVMMSKPTNGSFNSVPQSPRIHSKDENHNSKPTFKTPNGLRNEKKFIGSSVRIIKGPLKGKIGIIKDLKLDAATIELHSEFKSVKVSKENFRICNSDGQMVDSAFGTPYKSNYTGVSSVFGGKTPNYGSQTPMYGATTPFNRYGDGSRTPQAGSSHTPRLSGSDTPRAGAFDPVAATPSHHFSGSDDLFNDEQDAKTPAYMSSSRQNNDVDEEDSDVGNWYSKINNTPPQSPGHYPQTPTMDPYYVFTPASPGYSSSHDNNHTEDYGNLEPLPRAHLVKNVEVLINMPDNSIKKGVIQGERNGMVSVNLVDEKRIINVGINSVFRKEPESGSNVIYFDPMAMNSQYFGKCLSVENGEAVTNLANGNLKLIPLKDVVPYCSDEIA